MTIKERAKKVIAQGGLTNSKRPETFVEGVYPTHLQKGLHCYTFDDKGKIYVDYICALGTNLIGYRHKSVNAAVIEALNDGGLLSLGTIREVEYGERLCGLFPWIEKIKILKTGSEGCAAAIRIARAYTGREMVFSQGYNGWHDESTSLTPPAIGVPKHDKIRRLEEFYELDPSIAAVILEPVITDYSNERLEWLKSLRTKCRQHGIVLIFDETITGFRFPGLSFSKWAGIEPDITVMGKALANGLPISIVGGNSALLDGDYFVSSSFSGDTLAIAASQAVIKTLTDSEWNINRIWEDAIAFKDQFNSINREYIWLDGYPTRGRLLGKSETIKALFMQEMCKAGILFGPSYFWCAQHVHETFNTISLARQAITRIANGECKLEGKMPVTPFAQKVRHQ